jgi:hypothetical protein
MRPAPRDAASEPQGLEKLGGFRSKLNAATLDVQLSTFFILLGAPDPALLAGFAALAFGETRQ